MSALEARAAQHRTSARLELHQERRRKEALKRQKDARSDRANRARVLEPETPIEVDQQPTKAQRKKQRAFDEARQRSERWSGELCSYDWLCDIPVNLNGTNTSEGCMFHESANPVFGRSCNPHDLGRTPGGSSGGCAAVVGACGAPLAVTSDVGGSTRRRIGQRVSF